MQDEHTDGDPFAYIYDDPGPIGESMRARRDACEAPSRGAKWIADQLVPLLAVTDNPQEAAALLAEAMWQDAAHVAWTDLHGAAAVLDSLRLPADVHEQARTALLHLAFHLTAARARGGKTMREHLGAAERRRLDRVTVHARRRFRVNGGHARTSARPRGAGRPARRAGASSSTAGSDPGDPDEPPADPPASADSPPLAPRPSILSGRQARADIAAQLAPGFVTTADLARFLIRRLGWSWTDAYAATGDVELYGPLAADRQGRITRPAGGAR